MSTIQGTNKRIAIACQGGGSHAAFTGGVLPVLLHEFDNLGAARAGFAHLDADRQRQPGAEAAQDAPLLAAISGNSGGAISALLGWYGFVTGGAAEAQQRLDSFWQDNAATGWSEWGLNRFWRALGDGADMAGWDIKSSPYEFPLSCATWFNRIAWPLIASSLGPANPWMRPEFFSLPRLLEPCVDWPLVAALGEFASIPLEIERWVRSHLEAALFAPEAPCRQRYAADRLAIEGRIGARLAALERLHARMDALRIGDDALLRAALRRWRAPPQAFRDGQGFDERSLAGLAAAVQAVTRHVPQLLLGAVELHEGDFMTFSSERAPDDGGITLEAVLASAAVPWLFQAQPVAGTDQDTLAPRGLMLWDGLLSQNPPVRNFLAGLLDDASKPDEIWVVQINPYQARTAPGPLPRSARQLVMSGGEVWDLRNALSGNLSLNQEIGFVDAVNRRIEKEQRQAQALRAELARRGPDGAASDGGDGQYAAHGGMGGDGEDGDDASAARLRGRRLDKPVRVDRIVMDSDGLEGATGLQLGATSKLDRDPHLQRVLSDHGRSQARRYLALRRQVDPLCGALDATLAAACASAAAREDASAGAAAAGAACRAVGGHGRLVIDGAVLYGMRRGDPAVPQALVRWRTVDARLDAGAGTLPVHIEGRSELADDAAHAPQPGPASAQASGRQPGPKAWRIKEVRITALKPDEAADLRSPASPQPQAQARPQEERRRTTH